MSSKIVRMARELLTIEDDLKFRFDYSNEQPTIDDFDIIVFEQTWGSTALGFGGIGGQAMTSAMTYVFIPVTCDQECFVYFGGRFAYHVPYSSAFLKDVNCQRVESVARADKYRKE